MTDMQINHSMAQALIEVLQDNIDGEPVEFTQQGDRSLIVGFSVNAFEITTAGTVLEA